MNKPYAFSMLVLAFLFVMGCQPKSADSAISETEEQTEESSTEKRPSPLASKEGKTGSKTIKVQYGSPAVKGRTIWGDLVPYNVVWRTGANEATYIDISEAITVEGTPLAAGKYSLFTIPKESGAWTVIFNSDWDLEHGHFQHNEKNDVLRVEVLPQWSGTTQENLSIDVEAPGLVIRWEKLILPIAIQ